MTANTHYDVIIIGTGAWSALEVYQHERYHTY
jgi:hypothetical protein